MSILEELIDGVKEIGSNFIDHLTGNRVVEKPKAIEPVNVHISSYIGNEELRKFAPDAKGAIKLRVHYPSTGEIYYQIVIVYDEVLEWSRPMRSVYPIEIPGMEELSTNLEKAHLTMRTAIDKSCLRDIPWTLKLADDHSGFYEILSSDLIYRSGYSGESRQNYIDRADANAETHLKRQLFIGTARKLNAKGMFYLAEGIQVYVLENSIKWVTDLPFKNTDCYLLRRPDIAFYLEDSLPAPELSINDKVILVTKDALKNCVVVADDVSLEADHCQRNEDRKERIRRENQAKREALAKAIREHFGS